MHGGNPGSVRNSVSYANIYSFSMVIDYERIPKFVLSLQRLPCVSGSTLCRKKFVSSNRKTIVMHEYEGELYLYFVVRGNIVQRGSGCVDKSLVLPPTTLLPLATLLLPKSKIKRRTAG